MTYVSLHMILQYLSPVNERDKGVRAPKILSYCDQIQSHISHDTLIYHCIQNASECHPVTLLHSATVVGQVLCLSLACSCEIPYYSSSPGSTWSSSKFAVSMLIENSETSKSVLIPAWIICESSVSCFSHSERLPSQNTLSLAINLYPIFYLQKFFSYSGTQLYLIPPTGKFQYN